METSLCRKGIAKGGGVFPRGARVSTFEEKRDTMQQAERNMLLNKTSMGFIRRQLVMGGFIGPHRRRPVYDFGPNHIAFTTFINLEFGK